MSELVDFDAARRDARAPGFIIGGERFAVQAISFEDFAAWQDSGDKENFGQLNEESVALIEKAIVPEDRDRWQKLLKRKTDALTQGDLNGLVRWIVEQQTARPTMQPSSSGRGPVRLSDGSGGGRPSPVAAAGA